MAIKIFFVYAHEDEPFLKKLKTHLSPLQREGLIDVWYDRDISAGRDWKRLISQHLKTSQIIILLVSPDFMNSEYCYGVEMKKAMYLHELGKTRVIPVILRPLQWDGTPFRKLQALPTYGQPVTSPKWSNKDEAYMNVTEGIRKAVEEISKAITIFPEMTPLNIAEEKTMQQPFISITSNLKKPPAIPSVSQSRLGLLFVQEKQKPGRRYEIVEKIFSIGRSSESDIYLADRLVSRLHATIVKRSNGSYILKDEGSSNGTTVNGQMITPYQPYDLEGGDRIQIGQAILVFVIL